MIIPHQQAGKTWIDISMHVDARETGKAKRIMQVDGLLE